MMLPSRNNTYSFQKRFLVILTGFFSLIIPQVLGQGPGINLAPLKLQAGSYIMLHDSLIYVNKDTLIYIPASYLTISDESESKTDIFFDSLETRAARTKIGKTLYDLVVVPREKTSPGKINNLSTSNLTEYSGKTIRDISVRVLAPFGTSVYNPVEESKQQPKSFVNLTHIKTREFIIRNYLQFQKNDTLSPLVLSENERIIRKLPFIDDARIIVIPVGEELVDVIVVAKDIYSLGTDISFDGLKAGTINLIEKNIGGFGQALTISFPYNYYKDYPPGVGVSYSMKNIGRSFIDAEFSFLNALGKTSYEAKLTKEFLTANTRYAGGLTIRELYTTEDLDTLAQPEPLEYNYLDLWGGRAFLLNPEHVSKLVVAFRYINNNVYRKPKISSTSYRSLQKYKMYMVSAGLSRQQYYKTNLIYNYGRNEDIPYGAMVKFTFGREFNEFVTRNYYGAEGSFGKFVDRIGYLYGRLQISNFTRSQQPEQRILNTSFTYLSSLYGQGNYKWRYFASLNYIRGFNMFNDEYLRVGDKYGVRGYSNDSIRVNSRIYCNLEAVTFSPIYVYGFRFVFFAFADIAFLDGNMTTIANYSPVTSMGIGIRLRNDNLIFNTLQIRIGYFFSAPEYSDLEYINVTSEKLLHPANFEPGKPRIYRFR